MVSSPNIDTVKFLKFVLLITILVLGYEMRLSTVELTSMQMPLRADAYGYYAYATNLVENQRYSRDLSEPSLSARPDFLRSPGYPLFAALLYAENPGDFYSNITHAQLLLSALAGLILFVVAWKMSNYWFAIAITFVYATSPHIINMNLYFLTESLMTSLLILLMLSIYLVIFTNRKLAWMLAGLVLAYAALTRPYIKYFIVLVGPYLYYATGRKNLYGLASMLIVFGCVYGPWFFITSSVDGANKTRLMISTIHHGLYPDFKYNNDPRTKGYPYRFDPGTAAISRSLGSVTSELIRRFKTRPLEHLRWFVLGKPLTLWQWSMIQGADEIFIYEVRSSPWDYLPHFKFSLKFQKIIHYPIVFTAFVFCIMCWLPFMKHIIDRRKLTFLRAISLGLIYGTLIHQVGAPFPRYQDSAKTMDVFYVVYRCLGNNAVFAFFRRTILPRFPAGPKHR